MMPEEKAPWLALLDHAGKWCRDAEVLEASGNSVVYDDDTAVAWDITGGLCPLLGWQRACLIFGQRERQIHGKRIMFGLPPGVNATNS